MREVIEEGRRSFKSRIREMTVPGRYRSPAFTDAKFADKEKLPARARRDLIMHSPSRCASAGDGTYSLDYDGCLGLGLALVELHALGRCRGRSGSCSPRR